MAKDWRDWLVENPDIVHGKPANENTRVLNKDILDFDTEGSKIKSKKFMDKFKFDPLGQFEKSFAEMAEEALWRHQVCPNHRTTEGHGGHGQCIQT